MKKLAATLAVVSLAGILAVGAHAQPLHTEDGDWPGALVIHVTIG